MSDAARRAAERRADDPGRLLLERVRLGELDRPRLVLAARLGSRAARLALGEPPPGACWPELTVEDEPGGFTARVLAATEQEPLVRASLAGLVLGARALPRFEAGLPWSRSSPFDKGLFLRGTAGMPDLIDAWAMLMMAEFELGRDEAPRATVQVRDADGIARQLSQFRWATCERPVAGQVGVALARLEDALGFAEVGRVVQVTGGGGSPPQTLLVETSVGVYALGGPPPHRMLAEAWLRRGFEARAERRASVELAAAKDDVARGMGYGARAQARSAQGDIEGAAADWERAKQLRPDAVAPRWGQGLLRWSQGDLQGAATVLEEAAGLTQDRLAPQAALDRARVLVALGQHSRAISEVEPLLAEPANPDRIDARSEARRGAFVLRSSARRLAGRPDLALVDAEAAVALRSTDVWTLLERGRVHEALGDVPGMRADAEAALRLAPQLSAALALRGQARALGGDLPGALEDLRAAVARRPDEPTHREELGRLLLAMGRPEEGQRELDEARRLAPWRFRAGEPRTR